MRFWRWAARFFAILFVYRAVVFCVHSIVDGDGALIALSVLMVAFALAFGWLMWQMDGEFWSERRPSRDKGEPESSGRSARRRRS